MEIVDAQIHAWEPDGDRYPWIRSWGTSAAASRTRKHMEKHVVTASDVRAMMRAVGVDAAVLVSSIVYGSDYRYSFDAAARYPGVFGVVGPVTPQQEGVEEVVRTFRQRENGLGVRIVILTEEDERSVADGGYDAILKAARSGDVPVHVVTPGRLRPVATAAERFPDVQLVVDHVGLPQPPLMEADPEPFGALPEVLALNSYENVAIKWTGVPTLSAHPYPFRDLWPPFHRLLEAFGPERVMWGTDITRVGDLHTHCEALAYMRYTNELSAAEKELILGGTLRRVLRWRGDSDV